MGSEGSSKKIEETVGGLVWVRRRNGSWWPGRIMGLHELPESCLLSPRSGTPVKLLGRDDASVDWYNLEKSKRVKAFRCGEYDECIEKAKASAASANKKAVKYARREDAILHALELEGPRESDEDQVLQSRRRSSTRKKQGSRVRKPKSVSSSDSEHNDMDGKESMSEANLAKELSQSGLTFEDPNHVSTTQEHCLQKARRKTPNDSEDDGSEGTKRMRGLEDLGMGVLSQKKSSVHSDSEGSDDLVQQDSASFSDPNTGSSLSNGSPVNGSMDSCSHPRKRQAQVVLGHENLKRKNRCRTLTKVLESTAMVSVPVFCDQGASPGQSSLQGAGDSKVSALESTDSKKTSVSVVINNTSNCGASCDKEILLDPVYTCDTGVDAGHILSDPKGSNSTILEFPENDGSEGLFDVPFVGEQKDTQDSSAKLQAGASGRRPNHCGTVGPISLHNEGLDESGSTSLTVNVNSLSPMVAKHTSKWQSKRKRNSRTQSHKTSKHMDLRRSVDRDSESDVSLTGKHHTDGFLQGFGRKVEIDTFDESHGLDNSVHWSSQITEPNYLDSGSYGRRNLSNRERVDQSMDRKLNLSHDKCVVTNIATQMRNKEYYTRDESVASLIPHRSLPYRQSRFTPHSKYQDAYVPSRNVFENLFDVNLEVRASYPGRHVPLVSLMSKLNGKAIVGHPVTVEVCNDGYCDLLLNRADYLASSSGELYEVPENLSDRLMDVTDVSLHEEGGYAKTVDSLLAEAGYVPRPVTHLSIKTSASLKKSPKARKSGFLSKKTRKLSSFVAPDRRDHDRKPVVEKLGGPVIACVPLNIVFSRINEALNGSARSAHRKLASSNP